MNPGAPKSISHEFQKEMTKNTEGKKKYQRKEKKNQQQCPYDAHKACSLISSYIPFFLS